MAKEIERKFLVELNNLRELPEGIAIKQGYIPTVGNTVVRVRLAGDKAFLTLKGENKGLVRSEFEYATSIKDAQAMIAELCKGPVIDKTRYNIEHQGHIWELDIFHGDNKGLIVAEIELKAEEEVFTLPDWVTNEVSDDPRYYNSSLLDRPYCQW
ncbi:MAG: adenylate cyclase [Flavobacteriales bacterium]|jgi:adenylate cyclase